MCYTVLFLKWLLNFTKKQHLLYCNVLAVMPIKSITSWGLFIQNATAAWRRSQRNGRNKTN